MKSERFWKILRVTTSSLEVDMKKKLFDSVRINPRRQNLTWPMGGSIAHQPTGSTGLNSWIEPSKLFHGWPTVAIGPWWSEDLFKKKSLQKDRKAVSMWFHVIPFIFQSHELGLKLYMRTCTESGVTRKLKAMTSHQRMSMPLGAMLYEIVWRLRKKKIVEVS